MDRCSKKRLRDHSCIIIRRFTHVAHTQVDHAVPLLPGRTQYPPGAQEQTGNKKIPQAWKDLEMIADGELGDKAKTYTVTVKAVAIADERSEVHR